MEIRHDIEKINRENFRNSLEALARPGEIQTLCPLFDSTILAMASVFLYAEVTHYYDGALDFDLIRALCGSKPAPLETADYLFFDKPDHKLLHKAKSGSAESPESSATLIFALDSVAQTSQECILTGPGIKEEKKINLPLSAEFIEHLMSKNEQFPFGVDIFLSFSDNQVIGLPRTTKVEVI